MAKSYVDIVKYMVEAKFEISGLVEKPDIIGAVFGQTEGLLGGDLDLRELQKNGKIGRIEIDTQTSGNRTFGKLHLPSSLGRVETCILGAAIESVDRVGPFETNFKVDKVEDTRSEKRKKIINRAKELVKLLLNTEIPDSRELSDQVESEVKSSVIGTYGPDNLPAGPDLATSDDVVMVEGRADVVNLLKNDVPNCIAVGGASGTIPPSIIKLCNEKETTLFLDGDRGGDIILRGLTSNGAEVDFVARAPDGKEVEELTRKEIIKALRSRVPIEQVHAKNGGSREQHPPPRPAAPAPSRYQQQAPPSRPAYRQEQVQTAQARPVQQQSTILSPTAIISNLSGKPESAPQKPMLEDLPEDDFEIKDIREQSAQPKPAAAGPGGENPSYVTALNELHNTLRGRLYGVGGNMMTEIPIRELIQAVQDTKGIQAIVFDGIVTQRLIELANRYGVKEIYGVRANQITKKPDGMFIYTKEHGKL